MSVSTKKRVLEEYRVGNCEAESCADCEKNDQCMLYLFFASSSYGNRTEIEIAVELLEDHGFRVTDAREERATMTEYGHVIDEHGVKPTGAILLRVVPVTPAP